MHSEGGIADCGVLEEEGTVPEGCIVVGYRMDAGSPAAGEGDVGSTAVVGLVGDSLAAADKVVGQRTGKGPRVGDSLVGSAGMAVRALGEHNSLVVGHRGARRSSVDKTWYADESSGSKLQSQSGRWFKRGKG
jgi:hypothetical protein